MTQQIGPYVPGDVLSSNGGLVRQLAHHHEISGLTAVVTTIAPGTRGIDGPITSLRLEAEGLSRLNHPSVPRVLDLVVDGEHSYLAVQHVRGRSLEQDLGASAAPLSNAAGRRILRQLIDTLSFAQSQGLAHGALSPSKVIVNESRQLFVLGFGRSRGPTKRTSLPFLAPELDGGLQAPSWTSDLYSLGKLMEGSLLNQRPASGTAASQSLSQRGVDQSTVALLTEMTARQPSHRPKSYGDVLNRLGQRDKTASLVVPPAALQFPTCSVDLIRGEIKSPAGTSRLTTIETNLLRYFVMNSGRALTRDQLLRDVWGSSGQVVTRAVDIAVGRLRKKLEDDPKSPRFLLTVHGHGYRFEDPGEDLAANAADTAIQSDESNQRPSDSHARKSSDFPTPPTTDTKGAGHPSYRLDGLQVFGREQAVEDLVKAITQGAPLVTLTGTGGIGKTVVGRLVTEAIAESLDPVQAVWSCDLQAIRDGAGLVRALAKAVGVAAQPGRASDDIERVAKVLAGAGPSLLFLDNLEHLLEPASDALSRLMAGAPEARFLVTSRRVLGHPREHIYPLEPLDKEAARELFIAAARRKNFHFEVHPSDLNDLDAIVSALDAIPLAIELAAAQSRTLSCRELSERLSRDAALPAVPQPGEATRSATLRGAIESSWQLLSYEERLALTQCTVFAGGFSAEAAEAVIDVHQSPRSTLELLQSLVDSSLLRSVSLPGLPGRRRFVLFQSIYSFAAERLGELTSLGELTERHAEYFVNEGRRLAQQRATSLGHEAAKLLELEIENLLLIVEESGFQNSERALQAVLALHPLILELGPPETYDQLLNVGLELASSSQLEERIELLLARAKWHRILGRSLEKIEADVQSITDLAAEAEDPLLTARSRLYLVAAWLLPNGSIMEAERLTEEVAPVIEAQGKPEDQVLLCRHRSHCAEWLGRLEEAERFIRKALRISVQHKLIRVQALCRRNLGVVLCNLHRLEESEAVLKEALEFYQSSGDRRSYSSNLGLLGEVLLNLERPAETRALIAESLNVATALNDLLVLGLVRGLQGRLALDSGAPELAIDHLTESLPLLTGWSVGQAIHQTNLAMAYLASEHFSEASSCLGEALEILSGDRNRQARVLALSVRTVLLVRTMKPEEAKASAEEVRTLAKYFGPIESAMSEFCTEMTQSHAWEPVAHTSVPQLERSVDLRLLYRSAGGGVVESSTEPPSADPRGNDR